MFSSHVLPIARCVDSAEIATICVQATRIYKASAHVRTLHTRQMNACAPAKPCAAGSIVTPFDRAVAYRFIRREMPSKAHSQSIAGQSAGYVRPGWTTGCPRSTLGRSLQLQRRHPRHAPRAGKCKTGLRPSPLSRVLSSLPRGSARRPSLRAGLCRPSQKSVAALSHFENHHPEVMAGFALARALRLGGGGLRPPAQHPPLGRGRSPAGSLTLAGSPRPRSIHAGAWSRTADGGKTALARLCLVPALKIAKNCDGLRPSIFVFSVWPLYVPPARRALRLAFKDGSSGRPSCWRPWRSIQRRSKC